MFRVTEHRTADRLVLKLEGRLSQEIAGELEASWRAALAGAGGRTVWADLTDVLLGDAAACEQLAGMHRAGVRFVSRGCLMREVVREITRSGDTR